MDKKISKSSATLAAVAMLIAGFGIASMMAGLINLKEFMSVFFATIIAAGFGTGIAFHFQNKREDRIKLENDLKAAHHIQNMLHIQYYNIKFISDSYLDEVRKDPLRHVLLRSPSEIHYKRLTLDPKSLSIFSLTEAPELIKNILITENNFIQTLDTFNTRSKYSADYSLPRLIESKITPENLTANNATAFLGNNVVSKLKALTDTTYGNVQSYLVAIQTIRQDVYNALTKIYPEHQFQNPEDDPELTTEHPFIN